MMPSKQRQHKLNILAVTRLTLAHYSHSHYHQMLVLSLNPNHQNFQLHSQHQPLNDLNDELSNFEQQHLQLISLVIQHSIWWTLVLHDEETFDCYKMLFHSFSIPMMTD